MFTSSMHFIPTIVLLAGFFICCFCLVLHSNILLAKHGWDIAILYCHKHGKGDMVEGYGTPGIGVKLIGKSKAERSKAGRAACKLFEKFADCE